MPPLRRRQAYKRHVPSTTKRKRTRSTPEPSIEIEPGAMDDQTDTIDDMSDYPTSPMRDSILFDVSLVTAEFHPHTSRILLATTSTHEVAMVYLPPSENASGQNTDAMRNGDVSAKATERRKICWLRDQTQEEARDRTPSQRSTSGAHAVEQDSAHAQSDNVTSLATEEPEEVHAGVQDRFAEAPGSSTLAS
jgi:hypothetical protein